MDARVRRVVRMMEEQLHRRLPIGELAATVGLSVSQLTRLFRQATGRTPGVYLHELRMARAHILLARTSLTVNQVMAQVGVGDRSHFARTFRRSHGSSPRTFRLQSRSGRIVTG